MFALINRAWSWLVSILSCTAESNYSYRSTGPLSLSQCTCTCAKQRYWFKHVTTLDCVRKCSLWELIIHVSAADLTAQMLTVSYLKGDFVRCWDHKIRIVLAQWQSKSSKFTHRFLKRRFHFGARTECPGPFESWWPYTSRVLRSSTSYNFGPNHMFMCILKVWFWSD